MIGTIYKITHLPSGKSYVGLTMKALSVRFTEHAGKAASKSAISSAILKHGASQFSISAIDTTSSIDELKRKERYWIKEHRTLAPNGYNLTAGGEGILNPSDEVRHKLRMAVLGKRHNEETKKKMRGPHRAHFRGRKHSMESIQKMRLAHNGHSVSEETREEMRRAHLGIRQSEASIQKTRAANLGRACSEETKNKIRLAKLGKRLSEEHKQRIGLGLLGNKNARKK